MNNTDIFDKDLNPLLSIADNEDLKILVDCLKTKTSEELTNSSCYKAHAPDHSQYADLIAKEIRDMGGNSFANAFRSEGPSYHEIVCDVADKIKAPYNKKSSVEKIENNMLEHILEKAFEKMSDNEKEKLLKAIGQKGDILKGGLATGVLIGIFRAGGFASYQLTVIIANIVARQVLGTGLAFATNTALTKVASVLVGPVGWVVSGIWLAFDIAGPAYTVTIPIVIHIAMMRKKNNAITCSCGALMLDPTAKFCSECGTELN